DDAVAYIFAINYDITGLITMDNAIRSLIEPEKGEDKAPKPITHNVSELLDTLLEQSVALVGKPVALMNKEDKVAAIQFLNDAGAFLITKSGDRVSSYFGISKFTLYSYLDASKQETKQDA
ncbi:MAG: helix-turn-helix domain-containing protein, partial [Lachnospiraceae bacterium]